MARGTIFVCQACSATSPKWQGRCPACQEWSSLVEEAAPERAGKGRARGGLSRSAAGDRAGNSLRARVEPLEPTRLSAVEDEGVGRFASGLALVDRVLGGGVVPGAATLVAGEPGIGKSTLLLQMGDALAGAGARVLYVAAEESPRQLRLRAERLGCHSDGLEVVGETRLEPVLATLDAAPPTVALVDSVQALRGAELDGPPGSIGQVRHCADRLVDIARERRTALFLVGHVTKDGAIAGPKSLEHLVDCVVTFEGEGTSGHRVLRAQKNRFGPTGEVALFEMRDSGLAEVLDPSRVLLSKRRGHRPGSAVAASLHGSRPMLVEVQALLNPTSFPSPRRMSVGLDPSRVTLLVAVLERFGGVAFAERDLFLNVVGGLALREPAVDLAVAAALLSADGDRPLPEDSAFFGEVGLLGEVRSVTRTEARLREVAGLGFRRVFTPRLGDDVKVPEGLRAIEIDDLGELGGRLLEAR